MNNKKNITESLIELEKAKNDFIKTIVQFYRVQFLIVRKFFYKKINLSIFCKIFSHSFGAEEYNHSDVKRFEKFGYAQKRYFKKCRLCKKRSFSRIDQLGNRFWEIES